MTSDARPAIVVSPGRVPHEAGDNCAEVGCRPATGPEVVQWVTGCTPGQADRVVLELGEALIAERDSLRDAVAGMVEAPGPADVLRQLAGRPHLDVETALAEWIEGVILAHTDDLPDDLRAGADVVAAAIVDALPAVGLEPEAPDAGRWLMRDGTHILVGDRRDDVGGPIRLSCEGCDWYATAPAGEAMALLSEHAATHLDTGDVRALSFVVDDEPPS